MSRSLAIQFRNLPRSAALRRPLRTSPQYLHSIRSYSDAATAETSTSDSVKPAEQSAADEKISTLEAKVKDLEHDILYHRAEIQTLTRRIAEERTKASEFAISSFARSLLGTTDTLTTALSHVKLPIESSNTSLSTLYSGVELTKKAMIKTYEQHGITKMAVDRGSTFDPNLHEATFQVPKEMAGEKGGGMGTGGWEAGEVVEVGKEGWMIGNRVLRPAQVGVIQIE